MRCVRPACAMCAVAWAAQWAVERQLQLTSQRIGKLPLSLKKLELEAT